MMQPGYQQGSEPMWWWKVALHLDEAQLALANAMSHNLDDPRPIHVLHDRLCEGQATLLEIFRAKGLLPGLTNGMAEAPMSGVPMPAVPGPVGVDEGAATLVAEALPLAVEESATDVSDQDAAAAEPEQLAPKPAVPPEVNTAIT